MIILYMGILCDFWWIIPTCDGLHDFQIVSAHKPSMEAPAISIGQKRRIYHVLSQSERERPCKNVCSAREDLR